MALRAMCDTKYRGPKDRSTQKSGPSGLDFWVRLAFGQAQNKNQSYEQLLSCESLLAEGQKGRIIRPKA